VIPNALDGLARALCVLALGVLCVGLLPRALGTPLSALGKCSLWVYALHLPFCYGRLAAPLRGGLDLGSATVALLLLCCGSVLLALGLLARGRPRAAALGPARSMERAGPDT
jgi:hypothetical protein